jgi:hypothetical protein
MAQLRDGTTAVGIFGSLPLFNSNWGYMLCDPALVDWTAITRNYRAPWAGMIFGDFTGSLTPYRKAVGSGQILDPAFPGSPPVFETPALEVRWPIVTGNTVTEIRKPPYIFDAASDFTFLTETDTRRPMFGDGFDFSDFTGYYCLHRYYGGDLEFVANGDPFGSGWTYYAGLCDPVTFQCSAFTIIGAAAAGVTVTLTEANMASFGFNRWDQIFFVPYYTGFGVTPPTAIPGYFDPTVEVFFTPYAPTDIPPPYDMPGIDDWLPGGYFA